MTLARLPAAPAPESQLLKRRPGSARLCISAGPGRADAPLPCGRAALVVAHPGHELRVHGWVEAVRPMVHVLTDGSGSSGRSRLESTRRVLDSTGAQPASIFGRISDADLYTAILDADHGLFVRLAEELADALDTAQVEVVVGDAAEGYNPGHDACRLVIDAAVALVNRARPHGLASFEFALCHHGDRAREPLGLRAIRLELTAEAFERKLAAARAYPELAAEVNAAIRAVGTAPFQVEWLHPVEPLPIAADRSPAYERYGQKRVDAGKYQRVLRYRDHVLPLARALRRHVAGG